MAPVELAEDVLGAEPGERGKIAGGEDWGEGGGEVVEEGGVVGLRV